MAGVDSEVVVDRLAKPVCCSGGVVGMSLVNDVQDVLDSMEQDYRCPELINLNLFRLVMGKHISALKCAVVRELASGNKAAESTSIKIDED